MRLSSSLIIIIVILTILTAPTKSDKGIQDFDTWRRNNQGAWGCHELNSINEQVPGEIIFTVQNIVLATGGDSFSLTTTINNFTGELTSNDVTIGYNVLDSDNAKFFKETEAESSHILDGNGDSMTPYVVDLIAPVNKGIYNITSYAVSASTTFFYWVSGSIIIAVQESGFATTTSFTDDETIITNSSYTDPSNNKTEFQTQYTNTTNEDNNPIFTETITVSESTPSLPVYFIPLQFVIFFMIAITHIVKHRRNI